MTSTWTLKRIGILEKQWLEGISTRDIADGLGVTRNAVIGKANREVFPVHAAARPHIPIAEWEHRLAVITDMRSAKKTAKEIAAVLGLSPRNVYNIIALRQLPKKFGTGYCGGKSCSN